MQRNSRKAATASKGPAIPGSIASDALYRLDEAAARLGWGGHAVRAARRRGLKTHRCGKRVYVTGAALLDFVTKGGTGGN
jgi:hypothetical protein